MSDTVFTHTVGGEMAYREVPIWFKPEAHSALLRRRRMAQPPVVRAFSEPSATLKARMNEAKRTR